MRFPLMKTVKWLGIALLVIKLAFLVIFIFFLDYFLIFLGHHSSRNPFELIYYSSAKFQARTDHLVRNTAYVDSDTAEIFNLPYDYLRLTPLPEDFPSARLKLRKLPYGIMSDQLSSVYWDTLTSGSMGDHKAIIFSGRGSTIWIKISRDGGKTWNHLYTGLFQKFSYVLFADENIPLWKNDSTLRVRILIYRTSVLDVLSDSDGPTHQLISDKFVAEINLEKLAADSDGDCLTDIMEMRYMTNPNSKDTDNDGTTDDKDLNPRFPGSQEPNSLLYAAILEERINLWPTYKPRFISDESLKPKKPGYGNINTPIILLITDDPDIKRIIPCRDEYRYIIMTTGEYKQYRRKSFKDFDGFIEREISPMYPADLFPNAYWINISGYHFHWFYFVKRTGKGWKVFDKGGIII